MATTINSYSVLLGMDASSYIHGAELSRRETTLLKRDIEGARSPTENFARDQDRLADALRKGAIDMGTYNRLLDAKRDKYGLVSSSAMSYSTVLGPLSVGIGLVTAASTAAVAAGVAFVNHMKETQDAIDSVADSANKLGVTYNELTGLRFAAQEAGGVDASVVDASIKKMLVNISNAVNDPSNQVNEAFKRLGVTAGDLMNSGPVEAVLKIADGMQGVSSQADKLALSMQIFGKSGTEMVSTLAGGRDAIAESVGFMNTFGGLTDAQVAAVQASNDAWDRVGVVITGISTEMAAEFAPAFLAVAEAVLDADGGAKGLLESMRFITDATAYYVGQLKDALEVTIAIASPTSQNLVNALDFSSGQKALDAVLAKREEMESSAAKKEEQRRLAREKNAVEEADRLAKEASGKRDNTEYFAMIDRVLAEEQKRIDAENKLAQTALDNAEKHFAKERENARKLRDDIAKGPASMEVGSAEAAKYMADQVNAAIAESISPDVVPTEEELLIEAQRQSELLTKSAENEAKQVELLQKLLEKKPDVAKIR